LEFRTMPVMDPSAFCLNLPMTGMSSATGAAFFGADMAIVCFATAFFATTGALAIVCVPGELKRLKVPERCTTFFFSTTTGTWGAGATALGPPPNRLKVPDPLTLFFVSTAGGFGGGVAGSFALKRERVGEGLRTGTGAGLGAGSGEDACLKKLKVGADFFSTTISFGGGVAGVLRVRVGDLRAGTWDGFDTTCGAGLGEEAWKKLNGCDFGGDFFSATIGS